MLRQIVKTGKKVYSGIIYYVKLPSKILEIRKVVAMPSYYPEMERKTKSERWKDNLKWLMKNKEVNYLYTGYGLDVKDFRDPEDFISHRDFCMQRDAGVKIKRAFYGKPYNDVILLRDKYVFSAFIEATVGADAIPRTIGLFDNGEVFLHEEHRWVTVDQFCVDGFQYVFKDIDGTFGDGVKLVRAENNQIYYNGEAHTVAGFAEDFGKKRWLIQELIIQHEALRAFKTSCVNTVRAITIRGNSGKTELFAAFLRVGNDQESFVDNRAKGGLGVGVDLETGQLMKYGFPHEKFGTKTAVHPLSGITFEGYQLPYWKETVDLILSAHRQIPDIATIGWDVTMTDKGPLIVEANDGWEISGPQDTYGGLKKRWNELRNA